MRAEGKPAQPTVDLPGMSFNARQRAMWDQIEPLLSINKSACAIDILISFHGIKVFTVIC